jgi:hypothetical protein
LKDLLDLGTDVEDTSDTDDEDDLLLRGDVDLTIGLGNTTVVDGISFSLQFIK